MGYPCIEKPHTYVCVCLFSPKEHASSMAKYLKVGLGWAYLTSTRNHILGLKILINICPLSIAPAMLIVALKYSRIDSYITVSTRQLQLSGGKLWSTTKIHKCYITYSAKYHNFFYLHMESYPWS